MNTLLYVLAIVCTLAAGFFSYSNVAKQQEQLDATTDRERDNARLEATIQETKGEIKEVKEEIAREISELNTTIAAFESAEEKVNSLTVSINEKKKEIATQEDELEEGAKVRAKIQALFAGENIPIDKVGEYIAKLEAERKQLRVKQEEIAAIEETLSGTVDKNESQIAELEKRQAERTRRLKGNAAASLVTAVDNNWGIVVLKPHPDATINEESKLIVVRGSNHVGRLKVSSIEPNRIIADIDSESVVPGFRIRPGDRVILGVENTR